ncbi:hypothetical protein HK105_206093 [Polyrhizophydium stewartii]|uniref:MYND-type domain-containing protein n=1 Tax=Polyrhizophydium stewartii TaxID=2732419 RepID=A0ABR4N459_9FUNG
MKFIVAAMELLDPCDELRPWVLDHPIEPGDDIQDSLPDMLQGRRLGSARAAFCRAMALAAFALGATLAGAGNSRHAYHMMVCAIAIYEVLARAAPRNAADKAADARTVIAMYREIAQLASALGDTEHATEYATRLVALHEIAVAESLDGGPAAPADDPAEPKEPAPRSQIDLAGHFAAQILLADVSAKAANYAAAVHAYTRALQLFDLQDSLRRELADALAPEAADPDAAAAAAADAARQRKLKKREICLKLVDANEELRGDALVSLTYARTACELGTSESGSDSGVSTNEDDVKLVFRTAVLAYKYALQLAGGVDHASSPPVAVIPGLERLNSSGSFSLSSASNSPGLHAVGVSSPSQRPPSIRSILDEAIQLLEDARAGASADLADPNSKRAVSLQLAILYTDSREEEKARELLKEFAFTQPVLSELDQHRRKSRSANPAEGYSRSVIAPFANVVYSPEVFKRLLTIAPVPETQTSGVAARITLSRGRRSTTRGDFPVATKALCTYCCMTFSSDDPIKCEDCAAQRIYVYYCTEECRNEHRALHELDCVKNRSPNASSASGLSATFSSLLSS